MVISLYLSTFSYISPLFSFFTLNWFLSLLWFTTFIEPVVSKIKVPYIVYWGVDLVRVHKVLVCYSRKERSILFVQMLLQPVIIPGRLLGSLFAGHMLRVRTKSWIFEKALKFAQQFSKPGKSLENGEKSGKMVKSLEFIFIGTTSGL